MTDIEKIAAVLADGRWHAVEEFADHICIDYRSRLTEMRRRGAMLESRKMPRTRPDGRTRYSNDWRDLNAVTLVRSHVRAQVEACRESLNVSNRNILTIETPAGTASVMAGRTRLLSVDEMTAEIMRGLGLD